MTKETQGATGAVAVTPSDTVNLGRTTRALYVGGEGNISLTFEEGQTVTFTGVAAGSLLPVQVMRVNSTSTTATSIVALF